MAGFGSIGALRISPNLHLQYLKRGGEVGPEQNVENFAPLWFGIVDEETGRRSTTAQSADAMKGQLRSEGEAVALVVGDDDMLLFWGVEGPDPRACRSPSESCAAARVVEWSRTKHNDTSR